MPFLCKSHFSGWGGSGARAFRVLARSPGRESRRGEHAHTRRKLGTGSGLRSAGHCIVATLAVSVQVATISILETGAPGNRCEVLHSVMNTADVKFISCDANKPFSFPSCPAVLPVGQTQLEVN